MNDATHTALCGLHTQLPTEVAAAMLATCTPDELDQLGQRIAASHRFAGASAVACAKSHPVRAEIISTRTEDPEVQRALLELSTNEMFGKLLHKLANSPLVSDPDLLREIHDRIYQIRRGFDQHTILERIDMDHALGWLERNPTVYGKNLAVLARRVARELNTTGELAPALRFLAACDAGVPGDEWANSDRREALDSVSSFSKELISSGSGRYLSELAAGRSQDLVFCLAIMAWANAEIIDEHVAELALAQVDVEKFTEQQSHQLDRAAQEISQFPNMLSRTQLRCTDAAWRIIAAQWPGLLLDPLKNLVNDDPQKALFTELALESRRTDLAETLLDRWYHPGGLRSGPLLNADQYRIAVRNLRSGVRHVRTGTPRPQLQGAVTVSYIPRDTPVKVVLDAWSKHAIKDIIETLSDARHARWHDWWPNSEEFCQLLELCKPHDIMRAVQSGTNNYAQLENRPDDAALAITRPYLDAVVARVPAARLMEDIAGIAYVQTRLTEAFGDQQEPWLRAWSLVKSSTVSLDAVISAATKLG